MDSFAPFSKKRGSIWLFKAFLIFPLILCSYIPQAHAEVNAYINHIDTFNQYYFLNSTSTVQALLTTGFQEIILHASSTSGTIISDQGSDTAGNFLLYFNNPSVATNLGNFVAGGAVNPPDGTYYMTIQSCTTGGSPSYLCGTSHLVFYTQLLKTGNVWTVVGGSDTTRIDLVSPYDGAPVSSTSPVTLEASGFVNPAIADLTNTNDNSGIQIRWNVSSRAALLTNCTDVICAFNVNNTGRTYYSGTGYSVFGSQTFNVSTSTGVALPPDIYTMTTSIIRPSSIFGVTSIFGITLGNEIIVSTTTRFTVGSTTLTQELINSNAASWIIGATTTQAFATSCNPISGSFSVSDCLVYLFLPNQNDLQALIAFAQTNILARAPWGYASRLVTILTDTASSTASTDLPTYVINFPSSSPLYNDPMTFNMQEMLDTGSSTLNGVTDPISGKTAKEILEPYIELFIAISALIIMFHDIMAMGKYNKGYADK